MGVVEKERVDSCGRHDKVVCVVWRRRPRLTPRLSVTVDNIAKAKPTGRTHQRLHVMITFVVDNLTLQLISESNIVLHFELL
jgi:hypothetical protein